MKSRLLAVTGGIVLALTAFVQACGEETTAPQTTVETVDAAVEASRRDAVAEVDSALCDTSTDLTAKIPDASVADGGSTTGVCIGCLQRECPTYIDRCNGNCECRDLVEDVLSCYGKGNDVFVCIADVANSKVTRETEETLRGLYGCLAGGCKAQCPTEEAVTPADASVDARADASDAGN